MSVEKVTIVTCDRCGASSSEDAVRRKVGPFRNGLVSNNLVSVDGADSTGALNGMSFSFDLCTRCADDFVNRFLEGLAVEEITRKHERQG